MADDIRTFTVTVPANTLSSAPQITALQLPQGEVERVDLIVPAGHSGQTGIALLVANAQVIPFGEGSWFIADDISKEFPLRHYPTTGQWAARVYNEDVFDHSFYLTFLLNRAALLESVSEEFQPIGFA